MHDILLFQRWRVSRTSVNAIAAWLLVCLLLGQARGDEAKELAALIDRHVQVSLEAAAWKAAPTAEDAEFLRRVHLDLHGVAPSAERVRRFLASTDPDKRIHLINELLDAPRFGEHFGNLWRRRLLSPAASEQRVPSDRFAAWLAERFNRNDGWDRMARDLLTATGKLEENPAVAYLIEGRNPLGVTDLTDLASRYFLGVRLNCAQCHDHPFVAWKQQDYWGMAAFFTQIQTPGRPKMVYQAGVQDNPKLTLATLQAADTLDGYQLQQPMFLGGRSLEATNEQPLRVALADWITAPENAYFARAAVNRLWWQFFGRGLVNPVDDMHSANAPSPPELLDVLSQRFAQLGFDQKLLCRAIVSSRTYQQTSRPGEHGDLEAILFGRMSVKSLSAEQLFDSLVEILGPPAKAAGIDARLGARHEFIQFFSGDGDDEPTRYERGIPHLLRLMNSPQFAGRSITALVERTTGRVSVEEATNALFLTILSRLPTEAERELAHELLAGTTSQEIAYRELAWALLMSSEFALNH